MLDPAHRAGVRVDAAGKRSLEQRLLAVPDLAHSLGPEGEAAGAHEVAHAVVAALAVDVRDVVVLRVERLVEQLVERPLPGRRVERGGRGEHAVEVEQDGVVGIIGHAPRSPFASFSPSMSRSGRKRPRLFGRRQAWRPSSAITAGTSVMRTTKASASTPKASESPIDLVIGSGARMNAAKTAVMMIAAAVTTRPLWP